MDDIRLLRQLVEIASPSGSEERACAWLAERAADAGFRVERDAVGNVIASVGSGPPALLFLGHIDTVPGTWPVRLEREALSGRGAVDAKGALVAGFLAAARIGDRVRGTRTVVAAVGEETDSRGAVQLLRRERPDALIVGEPSGWDRVAIGFRGQRTGSFFATSVPVHASSPEPGALDRAIAAAARVQAFVAVRAGPSPFDSASCRVVRWTHARSVTEESAGFDVDVRTPPGFDWTALGRAAPDIRWGRPLEAVLADKGNTVVRALVAGIRAAGGRPAYVRKAGTSDMNLAARAWPIPMASYGPGDPKLDHGPFERLGIQEFCRSIEALTEAMRRLASGSGRPTTDSVRDGGDAALSSDG